MIPIDHGIDRFLDRSIVLGYSDLGYRYRRRRWPPDDPGSEALVGRRALVTGAGGGLGEATALGLARLGGTVHLLVRAAPRAEGALRRISDTLAAEGRSAALVVEECDVADLDAVRAFAAGLAQRLASSGAVLDVIVHNAGVLPATRTESADGHELSVATHVLGPILMTESLLPALAGSDLGARVVWVASGGMYAQSLHVHDPDYRRGRYRGAAAYARSKRMQVELIGCMSQRWAPQRVSVYAMHPGWAATSGVTNALPMFTTLTRPILRSPEAGADTAVWLAATSPAPPSGTFWHDRQARPTSYHRGTQADPAQVEVLWQWVQAVGLGDEA